MIFPRSSPSPLFAVVFSSLSILCLLSLSAALLCYREFPAVGDPYRPFRLHNDADFCLTLKCGNKFVVRTFVRPHFAKSECRNLYAICPPGMFVFCLFCNTELCNSRENDALPARRPLDKQHEISTEGRNNSNGGINRKKIGQKAKKVALLLNWAHRQNGEKPKIVPKVVRFQSDHFNEFFCHAGFTLRILALPLAIFATLYLLAPSPEWLCEPWLHPGRFARRHHLLEEKEDGKDGEGEEEDGEERKRGKKMMMMKKRKEKLKKNDE